MGVAHVPRWYSELKIDIVTDSINLKSKHKDSQEIKLDVFAAAFLMPKELLCELLSELKYDVNTHIDKLTKFQKNNLISKVCKRFRVSKQAAYFRLKNLSNNWQQFFKYDIILIVHSVDYGE